MPILEQIQKDMVAAMKAKDEARLGAIRMLKAVKNALVLIKISGSQGGFKRRPICGMSDQCTVVVERFGMENDAKGVGE